MPDHDDMIQDGHEAEWGEHVLRAHANEQCVENCPVCESVEAEIVQAGLITLRLRPEPVSACPSVTVKFAVEDGEMWQTLLENVLVKAKRWHIADLEVSLVDPTKLFNDDLKTELG